MNQLEINKQRARLLTTARNLLNEEYQKSRSDQYTKWQSESNHLWISQGIMLPYPSSFGYPTEEEVVAKALELYNAQTKPTSTGVHLPKTDESMTASVTERLMEVSYNAQPVILPEVPEQTPWEQYLAPIVTDIPEVIAESKQQEEVLLDPIIEVEPVVEDIVPVDEQVLTEEQQLEEAKSNSKLRSLLAQFITIAKGLDTKAQKDEGTSI
jgi:hypothetical protein